MSNELTGRYLINARIKFRADKRELTNVDNLTTVTLQTLASYALLHLLRNHGRVIAKNELIENTWLMQNKTSVSDNTYYQMISHLRKSLEEAGGFNIITTIPRNGVFIASQIHVSYLSSNEKMIIPPRLEIQTHSTKHTDKTKKKHYVLKMIVIFCFFLVLLILVSFLYDHTHASRSAFDSYHIDQLGTCNVKYNTLPDTQTLENLLIKQNIICKGSGKDVILSLSENRARTSTIVCERTLDKKRSCILNLIVT